MNSKIIILIISSCLILTSSCIVLSNESDAETYQVGTFQELDLAISNANDGDTIALTGDIVLDPYYSDSTDSGIEPILTIKNDIILNLNSHKISWDADKTDSEIPYTLCIFSIDGCKVTFTGNGVLDAEADYNNSYAVNVYNGADLIIENGWYYGASTAVQVQKGSLCVYGGTFNLAKTVKAVAPELDRYIINAIDSAWSSGTASIELIGGTYGFNYGTSTEANGVSYIAEGYVSIDNGDGTYTVGTLMDGNPVTGENNNVSVDSDNNAVFVQVGENVNGATVSATVTVSGGSTIGMVYQGGLTTDGLAMSATKIDAENIPDAVVRDNLLSTYDLNVNRGSNTGDFSLTVTVSVDVPNGMVLSDAWVVFYDDDGTTETFQAIVNGSNVTFTTTHTSTYSFYGTLVEDTSSLPLPPVWDDDEYIPPVSVVQPDDTGDGTVVVVACAAAAVVAALLAIFIIIDRKP